VTGIRERLNARGNPSTEVTFAVTDGLQGAPGATFRIELLGGRVGDYRLEVPGMPAFTVGDRAVLFVAQNGQAICPIVGITQGYFRVTTPPGGGEDVVEQYRSPDAKIQAASAQTSAADAPWADGRTTVSQFKDLILAEKADRGHQP